MILLDNFPTGVLFDSFYYEGVRLMGSTVTTKLTGRGSW